MILKKTSAFSKKQDFLLISKAKLLNLIFKFLFEWDFLFNYQGLIYLGYFRALSYILLNNDVFQLAPFLGCFFGGYDFLYLKPILMSGFMYVYFRVANNPLFNKMWFNGKSFNIQTASFFLAISYPVIFLYNVN